MEAFVDDLKKKVQCSWCHDTLIEPKILQCFHTFCKSCIKRHAELIEGVNVFECPRCKSQTSLPELSSVEDLQPSLLHCRMLKDLALVEGEKVCSVCESHSSASWFCFDCDHSMCEECTNIHSLFFKNHKTFRLADLKKEDIEFITTRKNPCKSHPQHWLESFCEDCDAMFCAICLKDHRNHKTMSLDNLASIKKAVLSKHLQTLEQLRLDGKEKQQQEKIAKSVKQQGEKAKKEVKDNTKKIIDMLRENEKELLKLIDEKMDTATTNLNIIHNIPAVEEYIQIVMERGLASEMMNIEDTQCSQKFMFNHIPPCTRIHYVPNQNLIRQVNSGLGLIQMFSKTDHTKSTIEMKFEIEALKEEKLMVTPRTSTGELNLVPTDVIDVQIKPKKNVEIEKKCVTTDGKVEVEFMAKVAGWLKAEVQVNGKHVLSSPLVMNVKPQKMGTTGQFDTKGVDIRSSWLSGIAVNRDNSRIAVTNCSSHCVHVFTTNGDLLLTYGSQGSAQGQLSYPVGSAFLNDTDLVIADQCNHRMCIVNTTTGTLVRAFGNQGNGEGEFRNPWGVHVDDDDNIIVCDSDNYRVQVFTIDGDYQYQFGLTARGKFEPRDVITIYGLIYVSDDNNHVIHVFENESNVPTRISTIGGPGSADGQLKGPLGLAIDNDHHLLVCSNGNNRVQKFTLDGRFVGMTSDVIKDPRYITVLKDGQLLVSTSGSGVLCVK